VWHAARYETAGVVVIGGGVAGSAAAIRLAQNGQDVLLLEKEPAAHDKVCGEFIALMHNTIYVSSHRFGSLGC